MIRATAKTDGLVTRLGARALIIAEGQGKRRAASHRKAGINWHSAQALWPDLRLD